MDQDGLAGFMPHGFCYLWKPELVGLHVASDALIAAAYYAIPLGLVVLVRKRRDVPFHWMFFLFALFILACGTTHLVNIWTLWFPSYWMAGGVKAVTALASIGTAVALVPMIPKALALPSPADLADANRRLETEIETRRFTERELEVHSREIERTNRELERSNRELDRFAHIASHDLQEPLRTVLSFAQLLEERYRSELDTDAEEFIGFISDGAQRMYRLIDDLLAYSRVRTTGEPPGPMSSQELVKQTVASLDRLIAESDGEVRFESLPDVLGDESQLRQLFQNLIGNGLKFSGDDSLIVEISAERDGARWRFRVSDNGIGIEPRDHERVFEIFQRLHARDEYPGTGVGLAVCKEIVERHGGEIEIEPQPGQGATFVFSLPADDTE